MRIIQKKSHQFTSVKWDGGTTTQLAIYPQAAEYKNRNFLFRISTATIHALESNFTMLDGVMRQLMILEGKIRLEHENGNICHLKKFEKTDFDGGLITKSFGKAIDFNLMTRNNTTGNIIVHMLQKGHKFDVFEDKETDWVFLYLFSGEISVVTSDKMFQMNKADFIEIENQNHIPVKFSIHANDSSEIIFTTIKL